MRRQPRQERSRGLVDAILQGAARLLGAGERNAESITTNRIADAAGVSVGSLYQYFPGKEAIFAALVRRRLRETHDELLDVLETSRDLSLDDAVSRLVDRILAMKVPHSRIDAGLFRAAIRHGLTEESFALDAEYVERFAAVLESWKPRVRTDLSEEVAAHVLFQGLRAVMVVGALSRPELTDDPRLRTELTRLLLGYLAASPDQNAS